MKLYMHRNAMDLCIQVLKIQYRDSRRIKLKVRWWNLGYTGNPWPLEMERIEIKTSDWLNWRPLSFEDFNTPRAHVGR